MAHAYYTTGQVQLDIERNRRSKPLYHPLKSSFGQIRVLRIIPTPHDRPICGRLTEVSIGPNTEYTALSYQWGSARSERDIVRILVNEQTFWIRRNLWQFLDRVRKSPLLYRRHLWIDAICINQAANDIASLDEKNHQVNMMNLIYGEAHKVICWLGEPDPTLKQNLVYLQAYLSHPITVKQEVYALRGLSRLLNLPYWTRIWIVQEVVLARRITLMCGDFRFSWHKFLDLWEDYENAAQSSRRNRSIVRQSEDRGLASTFESMIDWGKAKQIIQWSSGSYPDQPKRRGQIDTSESHSLIKILKTFEHQECSNPLDKIYGLLGLMRKKVLMPNYGKDIEELCSDVVDSANAHLSREYFGLQTLSATATKHDRRQAQIRDFVRRYLGLPAEHSIRYEILEDFSDFSDVDGLSMHGTMDESTW